MPCSRHGLPYGNEEMQKIPYYLQRDLETLKLTLRYVWCNVVSVFPFLHLESSKVQTKKKK